MFNNLKEALELKYDFNEVIEPNAFGIEALIAAYNEREAWSD